MFAVMTWFFSVLLRLKPMARIGNMVLTSRYDNSREVFASDQAFDVVYRRSEG